MNESQIHASKSVVPREEVATPEDVAKILELTPEQIQELRKEQALRLYRSRAVLSPQERRIGRGIELERHYREVGKPDGLAEALAMQGRYQEAAEVAVNEVLKRELAEKAAAVDAPDEDCKCDNFKDVGKYSIPNQYIESYGYSAKHGKDMPFVRCTVCGTLNVKPSPDYLEEQRAIRNSTDLAPDDSSKLEFFKK